MIEALNFIKNQAGIVPSRSDIEEEQTSIDEYPFLDIFNRVMNI